MICAPEMHTGDIMVYDPPWVHEIEIKVSKSDLLHGEAKKEKHGFDNRMRNKFSLCVPMKLKETAEEWIAKTNKRYGLIICTENEYLREVIWIKKSAQLLHQRKDLRFTHSLLRKLSSMATQDYHDKYWKEANAPEKQT